MLTCSSKIFSNVKTTYILYTHVLEGFFFLSQYTPNVCICTHPHDTTTSPQMQTCPHPHTFWIVLAHSETNGKTNSDNFFYIDHTISVCCNVNLMSPACSCLWFCIMYVLTLNHPHYCGHCVAHKQFTQISSEMQRMCYW